LNCYGAIKPENIVSVNYDLNYNINNSNKKGNYITIAEFIENNINPGIISNQEQQDEVNKKKLDEPEQQTFLQKYVRLYNS